MIQWSLLYKQFCTWTFFFIGNIAKHQNYRFYRPICVTISIYIIVHKYCLSRVFLYILFLYHVIIVIMLVYSVRCMAFCICSRTDFATLLMWYMMGLLFQMVSFVMGADKFIFDTNILKRTLLNKLDYSNRI